MRWLTAAVVALVAATPAAANHVQCGDTITQDTTLDSDVVCAADDPPFAVSTSGSMRQDDNNGNYGTEAYRVTDAGGNRAKRNGNPAQCLGVRCK